MSTRELALIVLAAGVAGCGGGGSNVAADTPATGTDSITMTAASGGPTARALAVNLTATAQAASQVATRYALDFVSTAASGYGLNDAGDVVGKSYTDNGCGPFCLPPEDIAVWRNGVRTVLPLLAGYTSSSLYPLHINNQGLIGGEAGLIGSSTRVVLWTPNGSGYTAQNLGVFPGTSSADVTGLDDQGRMVGWSTLGGAFPTLTVPFMWSQATGMVNLAQLGYPNERPAAMSPGGKVVSWNHWYQLGDPGSVVALPAPPAGYVGAGSNGSAINDAGDQAHFLVSISTENLVYPFRLSQGGTWQQLSSFGTGRLSGYGMGSINAAQDVTFTVGSSGMVAAGPAGVGQPLVQLLSPAYPGAIVGGSGAMNASGQILAQVMIGRSFRLVKMTPVTACTANCLVSSSLAMTGQFVKVGGTRDGDCYQGTRSYNQSSATVTITNEAGVPMANVLVSGRFLDDYWTNSPVSGSTNASGVVSFSHKGLCGVGAVAFMVDQAALGSMAFDRTRGTLSGYVIPGTTPAPTNLAPVAVATASCVARRVCTLNGSGSYDPDGTIARYRWTDSSGNTLATQAVFVKTFSKTGKTSATLYVTDNGGRTASKRVTFTVLR
ncbi:PKD domain-containing protein [Ideonella sp. A 288]|uniref:PKD domain-containing protein n=1 Tax=Ideonella sp. A 288 TaxID=1962181 RepID=UPI000B4BF794|nr:PKD domain-containing protein [Ideonella sp. A 288]